MIQILLNGKKAKLYPEKCNWNYQSCKDTQFATTKIKSKMYFIKRQPGLFSGWHLLIYAYQNGLSEYIPQVTGISKDDHHYYYISEYLKGDVLENRIRGVDSQQAVMSIFDAVKTINGCGFWHSDLCAKNIFRTKAGYYLIDIDSSFRSSVLYNNKLSVSYDYTVLIVRYSNEVCPGRLNLAIGHPGECINQSQLIAFAVDSKYKFSIPAKSRDLVMHRCLLSDHGQLYRDLFNRLIVGVSDWAMTKDLIEQIIR